ncbi:MAG: hypothetical protein Ta2G_09250 [Termitinemataceae bacterium]|nr:MAG: hypothetical protein Ta2G_09250 [Termitinemataceae bacterium]
MKVKNQKSKKFFLGFFIIALFFIACDQDPIFYRISKEVPPQDPKIAGSPSKMVKTPTTSNTDGSDGYDIYVANGKLWKFTNGGAWNEIPSPENAFDVAVVGADIYVLCWTDKNLGSTVYKLNGAAIPQNETYGIIQSIYGVGNVLYAGARKKDANESGILISDGVAAFSVHIYDSGELKGAVTDGTDPDHYFATTKAVYKGTTALRPIPENTFYAFTGIFANNNDSSSPIDTVIAVTSNGHILDVNSGTYYPSLGDDSTIGSFTGAIAYWHNSDNKKLLLLGVNNGEDNYGYYEIVINGTTPGLGTLLLPGENATYSVDDKDSYGQQLRKYVVTSLMQAPGSTETTQGNHPVLFASTKKNGLWSYRQREDKTGGVWNAEEK